MSFEQRFCRGSFTPVFYTIFLCLASPLTGQDIESPGENNAHRSQDSRQDMNGDGPTSSVLTGRIISLEAYFSLSARNLRERSRYDRSVIRESENPSQGGGSTVWPDSGSAGQEILSLPVRGDNSDQTLVLVTEIGFAGIKTVEDAYLLLCDKNDAACSLAYENLKYESDPRRSSHTRNQADRLREGAGSLGGDRQPVRATADSISSDRNGERRSGASVNFYELPQFRVVGKIVERGTLQANRVEEIGRVAAASVDD